MVFDLENVFGFPGDGFDLENVFGSPGKCLD